MTRPRTNTPAQNPSPPALWPLVYPLTITVIRSPSKKPPKLPIAKSIPTAVPSPMGKTSSHPNSSMMGTRGIKKNELNAEMKLAMNKISVNNNG